MAAPTDRVGSLTPAHWQALREHADRLRASSLRQVVDAEPGRAESMALRVGPLYANFARQHMDAAAVQALFHLARAAGVPAALRRLFNGEEVNVGSSRVDLQACKLEYSIVSPK